MVYVSVCYHTDIHYTTNCIISIAFSSLELITSFCLSVMLNWTDLTMEKVSLVVMLYIRVFIFLTEPKIKYYFPKDYQFDEVQ